MTIFGWTIPAVFPLPVWVHEIGAGVVVVVASIVGVALTALTLPGIWVMLAAAGLCQWWYMSTHANQVMFSWWTLGVCVGLGVIAEVVELVASGAGAARAGGSRTGVVGSVAGGMIGAILGTVLIPVPLVGTLVGASVGAGAGAMAGERWAGKKDLGQISRIGAGAAAGRLAASVVKVGFAIMIGVILGVAAFV